MNGAAPSTATTCPAPTALERTVPAKHSGSRSTSPLAAGENCSTSTSAMASGQPPAVASSDSGENWSATTRTPPPRTQSRSSAARLVVHLVDEEEGGVGRGRAVGSGR